MVNATIIGLMQLFSNGGSGPFLGSPDLFKGRQKSITCLSLPVRFLSMWTVNIFCSFMSIFYNISIKIFKKNIYPQKIKISEGYTNSQLPTP
jgi:hypothetical protein